jgi:hypothetical protein
LYINYEHPKFTYIFGTFCIIDREVTALKEDNAKQSKAVPLHGLVAHGGEDVLLLLILDLGSYYKEDRHKELCWERLRHWNQTALPGEQRSAIEFAKHITKL